MSWLRKTLATFLVALTSTCMMAGPGAAQEPCSLLDVARYRTALLDPAEEATPNYVRRTSEDFLRRCPDRPEAGEARLTAARAALDSGDPAAAALHYDRAETSRKRMTALQHLDHSYALLAAARPAEAIRARKLAVDTWQSSLARQGISDIRSVRTKGGTILAIRFPVPDAGGEVRALWLGLPDGPALPASVLLRSDPFRTALRTLHNQGPAGVLSQHRCAGSSVLRETDKSADPEQFDRIAKAALRGYLRAPDTPAGQTKWSPPDPCLSPDRILYVP